MTQPPASPGGNTRHLPALLLLFVGSGCAALVYEVVWFQLLGTVVGSSAVSLGVLLGTFMGGMCLGSLLLPRMVGAAAHPLRVYAALELGIGVCGVLLLHGMPIVARAYVAATGHGIVGRAVVATICLLPPTFLMGATLPAVARWVRTTPAGVAWLGWFYGGNIAGAVLGSVLAGFVLLRLYDTERATYVACALNVLVAVVALALARRTAHAPAPAEEAVAERAPGAATIHIVIAVSGFTALSAEVVWTRILALLYGGSVYTFSMILAVYLAGLGVGSAAGAALSRRVGSPRAALGVCQLLIAVALGWAAYLLHASLPFWPINPSLSDDPWLTFQLDVMRTTWVVLPGAVLWGASFPLALAAVAKPGQDPGRLVGGVYAANTVGAIAGSVGAALLMVVTLGSQAAQQMLVIVSAASGLVALAPPLLRAARSARARVMDGVGLLVCAACALLVALGVPPIPGLLVAHGRYAATWVGMTEVVAVGEGLTAFVAVTEHDDGVRSYHNSGKCQASSLPEDMGLQRLLGHMTHLLPEHPKDVLVVGLGAGVTAGAVTLGPGVERVTIAEIEPLVPEVVAEWFSDYNDDVVNSPKVTIHLDDARHYLQTTDRKFDAITSDPLDPWVKGTAALYTREFFEEMKRHLNPGGIVTVFVQLYEANDAAVKSELRTFFEAFPNSAVFGNLRDGEGYDVVLVGSAEPLTIDLDAIQVKLLDPAYREVAGSLAEIDIHSAVELLQNYAGSPEDLAGWLADAELNRDGDLRVQYLAGLSLNTYESARIYAEMIADTKYPEGLFTGSPARLATLRARIEKARE